MYALLAALQPLAPAASGANPLETPAYNQQILKVVRLSLNSDNECMVVKYNVYKEGTSWIHNRVQCCRILNELAILCVRGGHADKLPAFLKSLSLCCANLFEMTKLLQTIPKK